MKINRPEECRKTKPIQSQFGSLRIEILSTKLVPVKTGILNLKEMNGCQMTEYDLKKQSQFAGRSSNS